jgi:electron transfer flavoprotein alpha subunit
MKILVFIKQVPEVSDTQFDYERKTLKRDRVRNIINPYDRRAISEAIRLRNDRGGEVIVASMGPPQAQDALKEALAMGADSAVHVEDARLAASDALVTARVLAATARNIGFDLIFTGQHSTDSETAQVPPGIAEILGIPCAVAACKIEYEDDDKIRVSCETDSGVMVVGMNLPALISAAERLIKPIKLKNSDLTAISSDGIRRFRLDTLGFTEDQVGTTGSPTWVHSICHSTISRRAEVIAEPNAEIAARRIVEEMLRKTQPKSYPSVPDAMRTGDREFWCILERYQNEIHPATLEILSHSAALNEGAIAGRVCAIGIGTPLSSEEILTLSSRGADVVYHAGSIPLHPDQIVSFLSDRIRALQPFAVFFAASFWGKYLAPRIAARNTLGLTGDCVGLEFDESGQLAQLKPAFGGNIIARIYSKTFPQMATIRPGALPSYKPRRAAQIPLIEWNAGDFGSTLFTVLKQETNLGVEAVKMDNAPLVVCAGMGLGQENLPLAFRIAELTNGAVGATRRVVDSGWLPRQFQVGLTGKFVSPAVYLGLGVSGRYNHTIGIQKSDTIIAINQDPEAEIFKQADLGIIGDCVTISRHISELLEGQQNLAGRHMRSESRDNRRR